MKIHYRKPITIQIIEAKAKNDAALAEYPIDYIELTKAEMDELRANIFTLGRSLARPYPVQEFCGLRIVEAK